MVPSSRLVARIDFLGTGNAFSPSGRMHALALLDGSVRPARCAGFLALSFVTNFLGALFVAYFIARKKSGDDH